MNNKIKRIYKQINVSFDDAAAGIILDYNMPGLTTRERVAVMGKLLAKRSMSKGQLLNSMTTADLMRALAKREEVSYLFTDNNQKSVHVVMFNDYYVGISAELHEFETVLDKKSMACND